MVGVGIDFVVPNSLDALALYEKIFEVERVEVTNFDQVQNEAVFNIYGVRFHMLDENPQFGLKAPGEDGVQSIWFNVLVQDIKETYQKAMDAGCKEIQSVTKMEEFGISNAVFSDPYGYVWMLHQLHKVVSFEDRVKYFEDEMNKNK